MPNVRKTRRKIRRTAARYGVRPELLDAQLGQEAGYQQGLTSPAGAQDIAQFMPETAKAWGVTLGDGRISDDIDGAARLMAHLLKKYRGSERKALAAYNAGEGNVDKYGGVPPFSETQNYVKTILDRAGDPKPGGSQGGPGVLSQRSQASYETVPGVDNSGLRKEFLSQYLLNRGKPNALLELKSSLDSAADTPPRRVQVSTSGRPSPVRTTTGKRHGLGSQVSLVDDLIGQFGAPITAKQEQGHAAGGDHDPAVKGATARDVGGDEQTREQLFRALTRKLGVKNAVYKGPDINVVKNGVRYQIISRDHGTGPHLHIGMRRSGR